MYSERIFVDTGAWVALADEDDSHHQDAASIFPSLLKTYKGLITSNLVVAESYILMLKGLGHDAAMNFLDRVNSSPRIIRIYSTSDIEDKAEEILRKYRDQDFSYTDAVSFAIMKMHGVKKSFSFDRHFETMGFVRAP
ncbi:MAG: type II toxin-antitoxin system VapC family toxin [Nitrospirota bacterium]